MPEEQVKNVNEWTAKQQLFIEWLTLPSEERTPLTQGGFAREIGVREETLSRWKLLDGFQDAVKALIMSRFGDVLHDVVYSFKREAMKGSYQHQRTYFEMMGLYVEKHEVKGTLNVEGSLSDDDLIARADTVIARRAKDTP